MCRIILWYTMCTGMFIETIYIDINTSCFMTCFTPFPTLKWRSERSELENEPHFSTAAINVLILMPAAPVLCCVRRYLRQDPMQRKVPIRKSPQGTLDLTLWWTNILPWKITLFLMGKSTISMAIFNSFLYVHQRVFLLWSMTIFCRSPAPSCYLWYDVVLRCPMSSLISHLRCCAMSQYVFVDILG